MGGGLIVREDFRHCSVFYIYVSTLCFRGTCRWTLYNKKKTMDIISSAEVFSPARKWGLKNLSRHAFYIMCQLVVFIKMQSQ